MIYNRLKGNKKLSATSASYARFTLQKQSLTLASIFLGQNRIKSSNPSCYIFKKREVIRALLLIRISVLFCRHNSSLFTKKEKSERAKTLKSENHISDGERESWISLHKKNISLISKFATKAAEERRNAILPKSEFIIQFFLNAAISGSKSIAQSWCKRSKNLPLLYTNLNFQPHCVHARTTRKFYKIYLSVIFSQKKSKIYK